MKLDPRMTNALIGQYEGMPAVLVDDACELLTMKVVLVIRKFRNEKLRALYELAEGTTVRQVAAAEANVLGELLVKIAEAE